MSELTAKTSVSFEFFPPKTPPAAAALEDTANALAAVKPLYMTVTYGAGGSTRDGTLQTLQKLTRSTNIPMGSHLTFCATRKPDLDQYVDQLWDNNIKHIVALRGDLPPGKSLADFIGDDYFQFTSDFVEYLRKKHPFEISVGAYPEKHPDAPSLAMDIEALRKKCDAGATRAITQFFFDNDIYYNFLEQTKAAGIHTPIIPGLLPVADFTKMLKFADMCKASVPRWMHEALAHLDPSSTAFTDRAADILAEQVKDLVSHGVRHIHFYTLNRADITLEALRRAEML